MKKHILVGQSGGPTAVINASLCGVITEAKSHPGRIGRVYGMVNGIEGFLSGRTVDLSHGLTPEELELLKLTPSAYLGSCRCKLPGDLTAPVYPMLFEKFRQMDIGAFFYIGGNDSMDTVDKLSRYAAAHNIEMPVIGIPKTIDNDLVSTDHTPGYGSAAKYVAATVREIVLDASVYQQKSVTIVELMGRHAGWVTAAAALARKSEGDNPLLIYLPEGSFDMEQFARDVERGLKLKSSLVICVSEGISDASGKFICEYSDEARLDTFGHKMLTGCGKILENFIRDRFHVKVRSIELNVNQRCSAMISSLTDVQEAAMAGAFGVRAALDGTTGKMVSFERRPGASYQMECGLKDVSVICNKEKTFPRKWITGSGTDVSREFITYALPLIQGEPQRVMKDGLPWFLSRE